MFPVAVRDIGDHLLTRALGMAAPGTRNETGFWLACQLRDNGVPFDRAKVVMREYVRRVPGGGRDYTEREALASLRQAYRRPAREPLRIRKAGRFAGGVGGGLAANPQSRKPKPEPVVEPSPLPRPPAQPWQDAGWAFVSWAQERLWEDEGALEGLRRRGLADETVRVALIGWNPRDMRRPGEKWGLSEDVWLPRGYVIPWVESRPGGDVLWAINVRRPNEDVEKRGGGKYIAVQGSQKRCFLYNRDLVRAGKPVVLVEGEFDALVVAQAAADIVTPLAIGGSGGQEDVLALGLLRACPLVLLAFDADEAGERKAKEWRERIGVRARRWEPYWEDASAMASGGVSVRRWVVMGLTYYGWEPAQAALLMQPPAVPTPLAQACTEILSGR